MCAVISVALTVMMGQKYAGGAKIHTAIISGVRWAVGTLYYLHAIQSLQQFKHG